MATRKNPRLKNRIKELCKDAGIQPTDLGEKINRAQSTISQYITGTRFPNEDSIVAMCDELKCQPGDIFYVVPQE